MKPYFDGILLNCSNDELFYDNLKIKKITSDDSNQLNMYLVNQIKQNFLDFIPNETIVEFSQLILDKNLIQIMDQGKDAFKQKIIEDYSNQIRIQSSIFF